MYDTMKYISCDVSTLCIGQACSMGSFLLAGGTKGKRYSLPNSRIMIHQPSGGARGMASDIEIQAREILELKKRLNKIYAENTGNKLSVIEKAMDRDNFMNPEEAKELLTYAYQNDNISEWILNNTNEIKNKFKEYVNIKFTLLTSSPSTCPIVFRTSIIDKKSGWIPLLINVL